MARRVALVTDSTAMLDPTLIELREISVVPLQVVIGTTVYDEGVAVEASPERVAAALREGTPVRTSRPSPQAFLDLYRRLADAGAGAVVSVHLSGELSGTHESAALAAADAPVPVSTVDSRQLGMGTGFAVLAAADALDAGATSTQAAQAARECAAGTTSLFYVDTLEYLRRGGRIGAAAAMLGSALSVKPLLTVSDGRITALDKVRTSERALARLEELAVGAADFRPVNIAVAHLASPDRAVALAADLTRRLAGDLAGREVVVGQVGAVIGAHVGPGMVAVVVAPVN